MSKELIILDVPTMPETWDYSDSVAKVKTLIYKWKNITAELAAELYIAREKLSVPPQEAALKHGTNVPRYTWSSYCEDIGAEKRTVNRWLARFFPRPQIESPSLPRLQSQVLYADPPWQYANSGFDQSAQQQYPTMPLKDICDYKDPTGRKIKDLPLERAVLCRTARTMD